MAGTISRGRLRLWLNRLVLVAVVLGAWEMVSGPVIATRWISEPSQIGVLLWRWFSTGSIFEQIGTTLAAMVMGLVLGVLLGLGTGLLLGMQRFLRDVFDPYIIAFNSLPQLALTPLLILWFGIDLTPKVVLVAISVFLFIFLNVLQAVRDVDQDLINIVKVMGASQTDVMSKVVMPSVMAALFVGLKQSVPAALRAAVLGEMMAGNWGLGATIRRAGQVFDSGSLFAAVFIVMVLGALLNQLVNVPETRLLRWRRRRDQEDDAPTLVPAAPAQASI